MTKLLLLLLTLLACFILQSVNGSTVGFLPTEFVPYGPIFYEANAQRQLVMNLCDASLYSKCLMTAYVNFPFNDWDIDNGITVQYSIVGGTNCQNLYCSNDLKSKTPQSCSFYLPANNGPELYFVSQAGHSAGIPTTFSLKIDCAVTGNSSYTKYPKACPFKASKTRKIVSLQTAATVETSNTKPVIYDFVVCPSNGALSTFSYVLTATDQVSAFSSYFCPNSSCSAGVSQNGYFDASAAGLNTVSVNNLHGTELSVAIYGWGDFNRTNTFVFNIQTHDSN